MLVESAKNPATSETTDSFDDADSLDFVLMPAAASAAAPSATTLKNLENYEELKKELLQAKIKCVKERHWLFHEKRALVRAKTAYLADRQVLLLNDVAKLEKKKAKKEKCDSKRAEKREKKAQKKQDRAEKRASRSHRIEEYFLQCATDNFPETKGKQNLTTCDDNDDKADVISIASNDSMATAIAFDDAVGETAEETNRDDGGFVVLSDPESVEADNQNFVNTQNAQKAETKCQKVPDPYVEMINEMEKLQRMKISMDSNKTPRATAESSNKETEMDTKAGATREDLVHLTQSSLHDVNKVQSTIEHDHYSPRNVSEYHLATQLWKSTAGQDQWLQFLPSASKEFNTPDLHRQQHYTQEWGSQQEVPMQYKPVEVYTPSKLEQCQEIARLTKENAELRWQAHDNTVKTDQQLDAVFKEIAEISASEIVLREQNQQHESEIEQLRNELKNAKQAADGDVTEQLQIAQSLVECLQDNEEKQAKIERLIQENGELEKSLRLAKTELVNERKAAAKLAEMNQETVLHLNQDNENLQKQLQTAQEIMSQDRDTMVELTKTIVRLNQEREVIAEQSARLNQERETDRQIYETKRFDERNELLEEIEDKNRAIASLHASLEKAKTELKTTSSPEADYVIADLRNTIANAKDEIAKLKEENRKQREEFESLENQMEDVQYSYHSLKNANLKMSKEMEKLRLNKTTEDSESKAKSTMNYVTNTIIELRQILRGPAQIPDSGTYVEQMRNIRELVERVDTACAHLARHGPRDMGLGGVSGTGTAAQCELCVAYENGKRGEDLYAGFYS